MNRTQRLTIRRCIIILLLSMAGCAAPQRRLEVHQMESPAIRDTARYGVYLPPGFDGRTPLPLVVFLHGRGDDHRGFDTHRASGVLDAYIEAGALPPFIMVTPDGDNGFWRNFYDGSLHYEDMVMREIIPAVRAKYPVIEGREGLHIIGFSMGGFGAMSVATHHPEAFASLSVISALIFDTEEAMAFIHKWRRLGIERIFGPADDRERIESDNVYSLWRSPADLKGLNLVFAAGDRDSPDVIAGNASLHEHLSDRSIPHIYMTFNGAHKWRDWRYVVPLILQQQLRGEMDILEAFEIQLRVHPNN